MGELDEFLMKTTTLLEKWSESGSLTKLFHTITNGKKPVSFHEKSGSPPVKTVCWVARLQMSLVVLVLTDFTLLLSGKNRVTPTAPAQVLLYTPTFVCRTSPTSVPKNKKKSFYQL